MFRWRRWALSHAYTVHTTAVRGQLDLMKMQQTGAINSKQAELDPVLRAQTTALAEIKEAKIERANEVASVEAEARRPSNIIGTPPPEPTASACCRAQPEQGFCVLKRETWSPNRTGYFAF